MRVGASLRWLVLNAVLLIVAVASISSIPSVRREIDLHLNRTRARVWGRRAVERAVMEAAIVLRPATGRSTRWNIVVGDLQDPRTFAAVQSARKYDGGISLLLSTSPAWNLSHFAAASLACTSDPAESFARLATGEWTRAGNVERFARLLGFTSAQSLYDCVAGEKVRRIAERSEAAIAASGSLPVGSVIQVVGDR